MTYHWRQRQDIFNCDRLLSYFGIGIISCLNLQMSFITECIFIINSWCLFSDVILLLPPFVHGGHT